MGTITTFEGSCIVYDYPCNVGEHLIDPCNCKNWFECATGQVNFINQTCAEGTLYNHETSQCILDTDVTIVYKLCDIDRTWNRCVNVTDENDMDKLNLGELQYRCTGISPSTTATTTTTTISSTAPTPVGPSNNNTAAIVGGVIGGLLLIAIIAVIFILFKKRGKPISHYLSFKGKKKNMSADVEYDNHEETYTEIMQVPVYQDSQKIKTGQPPVPDRPSFTLSPALNVSQGKVKVRGQPSNEEVAYDNPGYDQDDVVIRGSLAIRTDIPTQRTYSEMERSSLETPAAKAYTPLSMYTRGPNPHAGNQTDGILQVNDNEYQVPKSVPEYYDLQASSNSVS